MLIMLSGCAVKTVVEDTLDSQRTYAEIKPILSNGDWMVVRSTNWRSHMVATLTNTPLSHAAIYDEENEQVIEALLAGVRATPLREFLSDANRLLIIRPIWRDEYNQQAIERARSWVGKDYNLTGLVGLNLPDKYYCSQLALRAYGPPEEPVNPIPLIIEPGQLYHWGTIIYDSGPTDIIAPREPDSAIEKLDGE
jgi:uncharacterized protein YycO